MTSHDYSDILHHFTTFYSRSAVLSAPLMLLFWALRALFKITFFLSANHSRSYSIMKALQACFIQNFLQICLLMVMCLILQLRLSGPNGLEDQKQICNLFLRHFFVRGSQTFDTFFFLVHFSGTLFGTLLEHFLWGTF